MPVSESMASESVVPDPATDGHIEEKKVEDCHEIEPVSVSQNSIDSNENGGADVEEKTKKEVIGPELEEKIEEKTIDEPTIVAVPKVEDGDGVDGVPVSDILADEAPKVVEISKSAREVIEKAKEISEISESGTEIVEKTKESSEIADVPIEVVEKAEEHSVISAASESVPEVMENSEKQLEVSVVPESKEVVEKLEGQLEVSDVPESVPEVVEKLEEGLEVSAVPESESQVVEKLETKLEVLVVPESVQEVVEKSGEEASGVPESVPAVLGKSEENLELSVVPDSAPEVIEKSGDQLEVSAVPESVTEVVEKTEEKPEVVKKAEEKLEVVEKAEEKLEVSAVPDSVTESEVLEAPAVPEPLVAVIGGEEEKSDVSVVPESSPGVEIKPEEQSDVYAVSELTSEAGEKPEEMTAVSIVPEFQSESKGEREKILDSLVTEEKIEEEIPNKGDTLNADICPSKKEEPSEKEKEDLFVGPDKIEEASTNRDLDPAISSDQVVQPNKEVAEAAEEDKPKGALGGLKIPDIVKKIETTLEESKNEGSGNAAGVEGLLKAASVEAGLPNPLSAIGLINETNTASITEVAQNCIKSEDVTDAIPSKVEISRGIDLPETENVISAAKSEESEFPEKLEESTGTIADELQKSEEKKAPPGTEEKVDEVQNGEPVKDGDDSKKDVDVVSKQEVPTKPVKSQSNNIISKVKQSIVKVKKAIIGKSPTSRTLTTDAKNDLKVK